MPSMFGLDDGVESPSGPARARGPRPTGTQPATRVTSSARGIVRSNSVVANPSSWSEGQYRAGRSEPVHAGAVDRELLRLQRRAAGDDRELPVGGGGDVGAH